MACRRVIAVRTSICIGQGASDAWQDGTRGFNQRGSSLSLSSAPNQARRSLPRAFMLFIHERPKTGGGLSSEYLINCIYVRTCMHRTTRKGCLHLPGGTSAGKFPLLPLGLGIRALPPYLLDPIHTSNCHTLYRRYERGACEHAYTQEPSVPYYCL